MNQLELSKALHMSDRRVRKMIEQHLLPEPDESGDFDGEECRRLYMLYRTGDEGSWDRFSAELERDSHEADRLLKIAISEGGTQADLERAGPAITKVFADLRFMIAAMPGAAPSARALIQRLIDADEGKAIGALLAKLERLTGKTVDLAARTHLSSLS
jgi:hypothetical protein